MQTPYQPKLNVLGGVVTLGGDVVPAAHTLTGNKTMNENLTFVLRNRRRGNTYFAFTDPEFGILFGEGTPPTTKRMFLGWWNLNKDETLTLGVPYEVGFSKSLKEGSSITCMANN